MRNHKTILALITCLTTMVFLSGACKKDRVQQDDYQDMESFYTDNEEEEQEITVDSLSSGSCYVVAKKGTRICVTRDMLRDAAGNDIPSYPFQLKVIELYSIKDMILRRQPSVAGSAILETSAEIKVRPFKNGDEVFLKPGRKYFMETATLSSTSPGMTSYYGYVNSGLNDWTSTISTFIPGFVDTLSSVAVTPAYYALTPATSGYVSAAQLHTSSASNTQITFTSTGTNTQNIQIFISFSGYKSVMRVFNLVSYPIPVGETITFVAFAKKPERRFFTPPANRNSNCSYANRPQHAGDFAGEPAGCVGCFVDIGY